MIAVADSGPLIALAKLNHLRLLPAIYGPIYYPQVGFAE